MRAGVALLTIPGYELIEQLASGASGTVYRAVQLSLRRTVAVKLLSPGMFDAAETRARFLREARIQAKLSHPNLLPLYDAGFAGSRPFLATEFVVGGTLRELLQEKGSLSPLDAVRLCRGMGSGLEAAHSAGIVHRDLKPENVLLTADGQPKVADFGLARAVSGEERRLTASGVLLGTPGYLAPEAIELGEAGTAADLYALGVMLYEMLAARRPYEGDDLAAILDCQLRGDFPPLGALRPGLPAGLESLIHDCLAREPRERPDSARTVAARLEALETAGLGVASWVVPAKTAVGRSREKRSSPVDATFRQGGSPAPARPPSTSSSVSVAVALALVLCGLGAVALGLGRRGSPGVPGDGLQARLQPTASVAPKSAAHMPDILQVTRGATRARLWLSGPLPAGAVLRCQPENGSSRRELAPVAGSAEQLVGGLFPAARYEIALALGSSTRSIRFETLPALEGTEGIRIATGVCTDAVLRSCGRNIAVAWTEDWGQPTASVLVRESADAGETWNDTRRLSESEADAPALAVTGQGAVVCWPMPRRRRVAFRRRFGQARSWTPAVEYEGRCIHLAPGEADGLDCLLQDGATDRWGYHLLRLSPAGVTGLDSPGARLPAGGDYVRLLVRAKGRVLAFSVADSVEPPLAATGSDSPEHGPWTPLKRVVPPEYVPGRSRLDAVAGGDTVVLVFDNEGRILEQTSHDRGKTFSPPLDVLPTAPLLNYQKMPAVAFADGRFYVVFVRTAAGSKAAVEVVESPDGDRWSCLRRAAVPLFYPRGLGMTAAVTGDRLVAVLTGNGREGLAAYSFEIPRPEASRRALDPGFR